MVNAPSFAFGAPAHKRFIHLDRPVRVNAVSVGTNHASAKLVQHLECSLIASQSKLALKLHRRYTGCLCRHQIRAQKPRLQWSPCRMHNRTSGQCHIAATVSPSDQPWPRYEALRLVADTTGWACE